MSDAEIDQHFAEVSTIYPAYVTNAVIMFQAAYVSITEEMVNQAALDVDYGRNETSEKASQRYSQLSKVLAREQAKLTSMIDAQVNSTPAVRWGKMKKTPTRIEGYPDA